MDPRLQSAGRATGKLCLFGIKDRWYTCLMPGITVDTRTRRSIKCQRSIHRCGRHETVSKWGRLEDQCQPDHDHQTAYKNFMFGPSKMRDLEMRKVIS